MPNNDLDMNAFHDDNLDPESVLGRNPGRQEVLDGLLGLGEVVRARPEALPGIPILWNGDVWEMRPHWWSDDAVRTAVLPVAGGSLSFAVDDPWATPRIQITDPESVTWLAELLGDGVAALFAQRATEIPRDLIEPTFLCPSAARLAVGLWLRDWWPRAEPISAATLLLTEIEIAVLTDTCVALSPPPADIRDKAADLLSLIAVLAGLTGETRERVEHVLVQAVRLLARTLPSTDLFHAAYTELAERLDEGTPLGESTRSDLALAAGSGPTAPDTRHSWHVNGGRAAHLLADRWSIGHQVLAACPVGVDDPEVPFLAEMLDWNPTSGRLKPTLPRRPKD